MSSRTHKSKWPAVKFGDFAENVAVRVDPAEVKTDIYVGLEHLDPESLHLKKWGHPSDVTGQKLVFKKGDVIFGRRRAYQRKLAIAEFDGICSAHAMVVRAKPEMILPEFLPFFLQSDMFMERAIGISVGSLSPTINWRTLKVQEFPLPPIKEQKRIDEILGAADEAYERLRSLYEAQRLFRNSFLANTLAHGFGSSANPLGTPSRWRREKIKDVCQIANTYRKPISAAVRSEMQGVYPYYGPTGLLDSLNEYRVEGEYVLIGEDGDHFVKYNEWDMTQLVSGKFNVNNHAHLLQGTDVCRTKWIFYYFKHRNILPFLSRQGAGRLKLNKRTLEAIPILLPPLETQDRLCAIYESTENALCHCRSSIDRAAHVLKTLTNNMMDPTGER